MAWLKRAAKRAVAALPRGRGGPRTVVLCYHSVHASKRYASVRPAAFSEHLAWLSEACDVVPLERALDPRPPGARPAVAITFDDGYADNHETVAPELERHRLPATFFITTGLIDRDRAVVERFARQRGCAPAEIESLSWAEIADIRARGFAIGAHTHTHPVLGDLDDDRARDELVRAKDLLEHRLGFAVTSMAYPYGKAGRHFTERTMAIAAGAGYQHAAAVRFSAVAADDVPLALPRFFVDGDDLPSLQAKVRGDWDYVGRWQERAPRWLARAVSPHDFALG
jgi:peptidoglycan/xylan/chitin deacetylase (PgdA/CDA1 family)